MDIGTRIGKEVKIADVKIGEFVKFPGGPNVFERIVPNTSYQMGSLINMWYNHTANCNAWGRPDSDTLVTIIEKP